MQATIQISIEKVTDEILALAALRHLLHHDRPALLTRDQTSALSLMAHSAFGTLCLAMIPQISDCDTDALSMTIEFAENTPHGRIKSLRTSLEHALALHVLYHAYSSADHPLAESSLEEYDKTVRQCRKIAGITTRGSIRPCWL